MFPELASILVAGLVVCDLAVSVVSYRPSLKRRGVFCELGWKKGSLSSCSTAAISNSLLSLLAISYCCGTTTLDDVDTGRTANGDLTIYYN